MTKHLVTTASAFRVLTAARTSYKGSLYDYDKSQFLLPSGETDMINDHVDSTYAYTRARW